MSRIVLVACILLLSATAAAKGRSPGKPEAKVDISYTLLGTPRAGQPLDVELRVTPWAGFEQVRLDFGASERLALDRSSPETMTLMAQKPGAPALQRVRVVPQEDGLHYLKVRVVTIDDGRSRMKGIAIPIAVGQHDARAQLKANGMLVEGVGGERAVVMPAR